MLRLLIIIGVFFIVFHFVYKWMKKKVYWINRELADELDVFIEEQEEYIDELKNDIINLDNILEFERNNKGHD